MRSVTTTLLTTFLLLFFSTTTSAYRYRKFPYTITCEGNRRDFNRYELQKAGREAIKGERKKKPYYYEARKFYNAGNCADLVFPVYKWETGVNDLIIYYAYEEQKNTIWYCNYEVDLLKEMEATNEYFQCENNYIRHTWGADEPPSFEDNVEDGELWSERKRV